MNAKISVIIPTYNRARLILQTVQSVFKQSYNNFEIIVIDDGSSDSTKKLLADNFGKCNLQYWYQQNQGRSIARNNGMHQATGEYLMFLDSDDLLAPDALQTLIETAQKFPESGVVGGGRIFINDKEEILQIRDDAQIENEIFAKKVYLEKIRDFFLPPSTYIIKKSLALQLDGFNVLYEPCEDLDFFLRYCDVAKVSVLKNTVVYMRRHEGNTPDLISRQLSIKIGQKNFDWLNSNSTSHDPNLLQTMKANWQIRIGDDFYCLEQNKEARTHYLKALLINPKLLFDNHIVRQIVASLLPKSLKRSIKRFARYSQ